MGSLFSCGVRLISVLVRVFLRCRLAFLVYDFFILFYFIFLRRLPRYASRMLISISRFYHHFKDNKPTDQWERELNFLRHREREKDMAMRSQHAPKCAKCGEPCSGTLLLNLIIIYLICHGGTATVPLLILARVIFFYFIYFIHISKRRND